jgi:hypothetical protein
MTKLQKILVKVINSCGECPLAKWNENNDGGLCMYMNPPLAISNSGGGFARWCALPDYKPVESVFPIYEVK